MIRVVALDDHPLILEAYQAILKARDDMNFVEGFSDGKKLMKFLNRESCEVLILDMYLGQGENGLVWSKTIHKSHPAVKILGVSAFDEFRMIKAFMCTGGNGFILKSAHPAIFTDAILSIYQGTEYLQSELKEMLLQQSLRNQSSNDFIPIITKREKEVLELIVEGQTTQEMVIELHLSPHTIESHRNNLMTKLNVNNVAGLVREALQKELLYP